MAYEDFHNKMGYCENDLVSSMARAIGMKLNGNPFKCLNCTVEKIQKSKSPKESEKCCTVKGE